LKSFLDMIWKLWTSELSGVIMIIFLVFLLILSLTVNGALGYSTWNLLKKNEVSEDYIFHAYSIAERTLESMREIDRLEMFEKDEDVGQIFLQMGQIVEDYAQFLGVEEEEVEKINE